MKTKIKWWQIALLVAVFGVLLPVYGAASPATKIIMLVSVATIAIVRKLNALLKDR